MILWIITLVCLLNEMKTIIQREKWRMLKFHVKKKNTLNSLSTCHIIFVNVGMFKEPVNVNVNGWNKILENSGDINNV
jgi:hypothetical protein